MPHDECDWILARYPSRCRGRVTPMPPSALGFSGARVWRIESDDGDFCLRAMPADTTEDDRLSGLHRLLAHTFQAGVSQVSVPVSAIDGRTFIETTQHVWQLEPWMPGRADFHEHSSRTRLEAAIVCLAAWHRGAATYTPRSSDAKWFFVRAQAAPPATFDRLERIRRWNVAQCRTVRSELAHLEWPEFSQIGMRLLELFARLAPGIAQSLQLAQSLSVPLQPCLRDVWHDHILFTGDAVTGLIDAHSARTEHVSVDLARLLGSLVPDQPAEWDAALAAYQRARPLTSDELLLVAVLDRSGTLLSGMTWLEWCCLERRQFADRPRVAARLAAIVRRLEGFAS